MSEPPSSAIDREEMERLRKHILDVANAHLKIERDYVQLQGELWQARRDIEGLKKEIEKMKRRKNGRTNAGGSA